MVSYSFASTYIGVGDEIYNILARLEAEGVVRSALLTTRPLSRKEALKLLHEAEGNSEGRSAFIKSLVQELKQKIRPEESEAGVLKLPDSVYAGYLHTNADVRTLTYGVTREKEQALNYNNDGDLYSRGPNYRAGFTARVEDFGRFSFFLNPEYRAAQQDDYKLIIKTGYAVFDSGWDLIAGKDSQWWGPGYNGAILLSNNAGPFTQVRLTNPVSKPLPWIFKYLGPFKFTFFITRLEEDRSDFPEPYLWGMRFNFKPHPVLELGLQRTALLGGSGRPTDLDTWLKSLAGQGEHGENDIGDQRAGYDLKLTLPFSLQPLQLYMEADAEDNIHPLPSQWAYVYGVYLPRLLSLERIEFRFEWAQTDDGNDSRPSAWYTHHIYTAGYTYHGLIIGHSIGTDSRDAFTELTCRFPEKDARLSLAFHRTEHNVSKPVRETDYEASIRANMKVTKNTELGLSYGYARIHNAEFVSDAEQRSYLAGGTVTHWF